MSLSCCLTASSSSLLTPPAPAALVYQNTSLPAAAAATAVTLQHGSSSVAMVGFCSYMQGLTGEKALARHHGTQAVDMATIKQKSPALESAIDTRFYQEYA
jgi:hypothetical protein